MKYIIDIPEDAEYGILTYRRVDGGFCTKDIDITETEQLTSDYINEHFGDLQDTAYQRGLDDAWEVVKALFQTLGTESACVIMKNDNIHGAIDRLEAYEKKQKTDDKIKVRDEVVWTENENVVIVVTSIYTTDNMEWCDGICRDGKAYSILTKNARKTGRRFDIDKVLEEMKK